MSEDEAPRIPEAAMKALTNTQSRKGVSLYTIISAQAGGVSDVLLRGIASGKLDEFKTAISSYVDEVKTLCEAVPTLSLKKAMELVKNTIIDNQKRLIDSWKAGLGLQMGTAFEGLQETYFATPHLISLYVHERLNASVRPRLERYWNSVYTPALPDLKTAFQMLMDGSISRSEFNVLCLEEGWESKWHDKIYDFFDKEPDEYLAFSMYRRGLITEKQFEGCLRIAGYDPAWHKLVTSALYRKPSFRELTNLADYVPLQDSWVTEVLRAQGYLDTDIQYILPAIRMRPLREEVRSVVGRYLWQYQIGRIDADTLEANLKALGLLPKEIELNVLWAELRFEDELTDLKEQIIEQRVNMGDITTEDDIFNELVALGMDSERANLLAELWYWEYIAT